MICTGIHNKLREQKGASLAMALFLLIVVTIVAAIMINSAYSNAGRVRRNIKAEQNYLAVNSAAELVRSYLSGVTMTYVETVTEEEGDDGEETATEYEPMADPYGTVIFVSIGRNPQYVQVKNGTLDDAFKLYISGSGKAIDSNVYPATKAGQTKYGKYYGKTYYYYKKNVIVEKSSTNPTTTTITKISFKDSVKNTEYTGTDYTNSGNPFAVKLMNWFENNIKSETIGQKTENNEYTITLQDKSSNNEDNFADVKVSLSISGTKFDDASNDINDKTATYIVVNLSLADDPETSGSGTDADGSIKKSGNENYYMSITIPFTATKTVEDSKNGKSVSDSENSMSLSALYDEDDNLVTADYSDDDDYDGDVVDAQDDSAETTVTTYTVTTAGVSGSSNNVNVQKGQLSLEDMNKKNGG